MATYSTSNNWSIIHYALILPLAFSLHIDNDINIKDNRT